MWRIRELDLFFVCFHFFGQTAYIPSKVKYMKRLIISSMFFKLSHFAVAFAYATAVVMGHIRRSVKNTPFNSYVQRYVGIHFCLMTFLLLYQSVISPYLSLRICQHFGRLIENMRFYLRIQIQMDNLKREFVQKILSYLLVLLLRLSLHLSFNQNDVFYCYVLPSVHVFAAFHIILFIDFVNFSLHSINLKLEEYLRFKQPCIRIIILFRYLKWMHFKLWKFSEILNKNFGLSLLIILIHYFLWIVLSCYYTILVWPRAETVSK